MALHLKHHLKKTPPYLHHHLHLLPRHSPPYLHHHLHLLPRHSSSFSPPSPPPENSHSPDPQNPENSNPPNPQNPQISNPGPSPLSSFFSRIKDSFPPPTPRRRIQTYPRPPIPPEPQDPASIPFEDLLRRNFKLSDLAGGNAGGGWDSPSFDSLHETLRQFSRPSQTGHGLARQDGPFSLKSLESIENGDNTKIQQSSLPGSIFGEEASEKARRVEGIEEEEGKGSRTEFVKERSCEELGEKLRRVSPEVARKGEEKEGFSLSELNERPVKLRPIDKKETKFEMGSGGTFNDLQDALSKLNKVYEVKKYNSRSSFL